MKYIRPDDYIDEAAPEYKIIFVREEGANDVVASRAELKAYLSDRGLETCGLIKDARRYPTLINLPMIRKHMGPVLRNGAVYYYEKSKQRELKAEEAKCPA
jgi:hypothetical protein